MDVPRNLGPIATAALGQADQIFIVCQLLVPSIRNAERYHDALLRMGVPGERIEFIINRCDGRSGRVTRKDLECAINKPVYATIPNDYQFVARSIDFGRPVSALEETNPVRAAIRRIAQQIVSEAPPEPDESKPERKGLLSRFLAK
jgi:pilus assembly protein CpaE